MNDRVMLDSICPLWPNSKILSQSVKICCVAIAATHLFIPNGNCGSVAEVRTICLDVGNESLGVYWSSSASVCLFWKQTLRKNRRLSQLGWKQAS